MSAWLCRSTNAGIRGLVVLGVIIAETHAWCLPQVYQPMQVDRTKELRSRKHLHSQSMPWPGRVASRALARGGGRHAMGMQTLADGRINTSRSLHLYHRPASRQHRLLHRARPRTAVPAVSFGAISWDPRCAPGPTPWRFQQFPLTIAGPVITHLHAPRQSGT